MKFNLSVQNSNFLKGIGILLIITHNFFRKTNFSTCGENEFEFKSDRFINFLSSFDFPNLITYFGHYGVQLFIFISGYGLMRAYGNTQIQYFNFIKKRLIKLYPTFLTSIIILYLYQFYILKWGYNSSTPFQDILLRISLIANFVPGKIYVVSGPYWFYSMIVQLYLLFPALVYIQKKKTNSLWYIVLFSLVITSVFNAFFVSKNLSLYYNFFGNLPVFCLGMILASKKVYFNKLIWFIALLIFVVGQFNIYVWCLSQISFTILIVPLLVKINRVLKNGYISKVIIYTGSISMYLFAINGFLRFPWVNKVNDIGKEFSLYLLFLLFILILFLSAFLLNKIVKLVPKILSVFEFLKNSYANIIPAKYNVTLMPILALLVGFFVFSFYFDYQILNPKNIDWLLIGDRFQHYTSSYAYRKDEWFFPLLKTEILSYPEGVSIVYTDSNPLLSFIFKIFRSVFPPSYQFFGFWFLLCWMLQSLFGYKLINYVTKNRFYALLSSFLFALIPCMIHRISHTNLIAIWLILWMFLIVLKKYSIKKTIKIFLIIIIISFLIHGYLALMNLVIMFVWIVFNLIKYLKLKDYKTIRHVVYLILMFFSFLFLVLYCFGFFYNKPLENGLMGYGYYSLNLNALLNPVIKSFSNILSVQKVNKGQVYEGFNYLGLGIVSLILSMMFLSIRKIDSLKKYILLFVTVLLLAIIVLINYSSLSILNILSVSLLFFTIYFIYIHITKKSNSILFVSGILCFLFSLSTNVTLGNITINNYEISQSNIFLTIFQIGRSSGRFFWVSALFILYYTLILNFRLITNKKLLYFMMICFVSFQFFDLSKVKSDFVNSKTKVKYVIDSRVEEFIKLSSNVVYIDIYNVLDLSYISLLNNKKINYFYMAHGYGKLTKEKIKLNKELLLTNSIKNNDSTVYFSHHLMNKELPNYYHYKFNDRLYGFSKFKADILEDVEINDKAFGLDELLDKINNSSLCMISVKDEASRRLSKDFTHKLDSNYGCSLSKLKYRASYLLILENRKLIYENTSNSDFIKKDYNTIDGLNVKLISGGSDIGNVSVISINDKNYSPNYRGLNVVLVDSLGKIKSYNFDTYEYFY